MEKEMSQPTEDLELVSLEQEYKRSKEKYEQNLKELAAMLSLSKDGFYQVVLKKIT
jgi:hypothetical protein